MLSQVAKGEGQRASVPVQATSQQRGGGASCPKLTTLGLTHLCPPVMPLCHQGPALLCCSDKVQGHLSQVLKLVRVRNSSPEFRSLWAAFPPAGGGKGLWRRGASPLHSCCPMADEWWGQPSLTYVFGASSPTPLPPGPALPSADHSERYGHLFRVLHL